MAAEKQNAQGKPEGIFQKLAQNDVYRRVVVAAGILGILLIAVAGNLKSCSSQGEAQNVSSSPAGKILTAQDCEKALEQDLTGIISKISGAGNVNVLVTLEQTTKQVYATQDKTSGQQTSESEESGTGKQESNQSNETTYVIVKDADGAERALPVTQIQPVVKGVVVVCDGGGDATVQKNVTDAVTTALHISSARVCVIPSKS